MRCVTARVSPVRVSARLAPERYPPPAESPSMVRLVSAMLAASTIFQASSLAQAVSCLTLLTNGNARTHSKSFYVVLLI